MDTPIEAFTRPAEKDIEAMSCCVAKKRVRLRAVMLRVLGAFLVLLLATPGGAKAPRAHGISANTCSQRPELFGLRRLRADEAMRLIRPTGEHLTVVGFERGYKVSGNCTRFIKTFGNGIILSNNARFVIDGRALVPARPANPVTTPQPGQVVPTKNVMTIASDTFAEGKGRSYVKHQGSLMLWSGPKGSAVGIVRCGGNDIRPCTLDHLLLSSRYRILDFGFVPSPHSETKFGSLWLQIALPPGEEASVNYTISWWQDL